VEVVQKMDIDPGPSQAGPSSSLTDIPTSDGSSRIPSSSSNYAPQPARRQLRARASEATPSTTASPVTKRGRSDTSAHLRLPTDKELEYIRSKLSEESILSGRDGVIKGKEAELRNVVDSHDNAVREKFHLERYISIFEGWDPVVSFPVSGLSCSEPV
jgi:hypothetical protein